MSTYFIGCLHFGHKNVAQWRGFHDEFGHDEYIIKEWNKVVNKKDLTYILGDVTMETSKHYYRLDQLNGRKIVVLGNHDRWQDIPELLKYVDGVSGAVDYKGYMLTHVPIHPSEIHFYRANLHAHIHENKLDLFPSMSKYQDKGSQLTATTGKYWNCDAKILNFKPKTLDELRTIYQPMNIL